MSLRCHHDLIGCRSRVQSSLNAWREAVAGVQEVWNDSTAQRYLAEHFTDTEGALLRTLAALQEAADLVREIEKRLDDEPQ